MAESTASGGFGPAWVHAASSGLWSFVERINAVKERHRLQCPGSYENLHREVKSIFTTQAMIEGARFDISSIMSPNFQVSHSFSWGSSQYPPSYNFMANYQAERYLLSGQVDQDGGLQARAFYFWSPLQLGPVPAPAGESPAGETKALEKTADPAQPPAPSQPPQAPTAPAAYKPSNATKVQAQLVGAQGQSMMLIEQDYIGPTCSVNLKAINPNPVDAPRANWGPTVGGSSTPPPSLTGNYSIQFLQSVTQSLAIGGEYLLQRPTPDISEGGYSVAVRYAPPPSTLPAPSTIPPGAGSPFMTPNPKDPTQIFAATLSSTGLFHGSYWRRLNQRLEVGTELQLLTTPASKSGAEGKREGIASAGFKLDTVYATVRGMIDSHGRISSIVEEKMAPGLSFQLCGELDYARGGGGQGRVGIGFSLEA
ncbi:translocase of outer mitochondrial membrane [Dinochytrium kinnereticum]|nr:translocase of outer mitochondrial membrane [Dinochytrium kinnereticum]